MAYATITFHDLDDEGDDRAVELTARDAASLVQGLSSLSEMWAAIAVDSSNDSGKHLALDQQNQADDLRARLERADEGI